MTTHEYAFDVKLYAVVRVNAPDEDTAREALDKALACMNLSEHTVDGMNDVLGERSVRITEASLTTEDGEPFLFELDGNETEEN